MGQKRRNQRFQIVGALPGTFNNDETFLIKDINFDGVHLLSNFSPIIGTKYILTVKDRSRSENFEIQVVRVDPGGFNSDVKNGIPIGVVYSVGARLLNISENKKKFLMSLLYDYA
jgi:hypothetical protein